VGAHGTGACLPPVEEQVVGLRLLTPGLGALNLSKENEAELFQLAKVGLGALGVVSQVRWRVRWLCIFHIARTYWCHITHLPPVTRTHWLCGCLLLVTHMHIVWAVIEDPVIECVA
jgi:hypothetical protein